MKSCARRRDDNEEDAGDRVIDDGARQRWEVDSCDRMTVRELKELLHRSGAKVFGKELGAGPSARELAARGRSRRTAAIEPSARRDDPRPYESPADTEAPGGWSVLEPFVTFIK